MANSIPRHSQIKRFTVGLLAQISPGFGKLMKCPEPMLAEHRIQDPSLMCKTLFVLLPGIQDQHWQFEVAGFIKAAEQAQIRADLLMVDAHIGYYVRETILERLREDIIVPAKAAGYEKIWLVGTSLGGLGSVLYAGRHESDIDGVVLLAPYLGEPSVIREIERSGGPGIWALSGQGYTAQLWTWLSRYFDDPQRKPHLYLGFGEGDRFAFANNFLARALPQDRVLVTPGSHDWATWQRLWQGFLERYKRLQVNP